jgi:hypothetical protein
MEPEPIATPPGFYDGFDDNNRPQQHYASFPSTTGTIRRYWSQTDRTWYPLHRFLPRPPPIAYAGQWTAQQSLESDPPPFITPNIHHITHQSSTHNLRFSTIGRLTNWLNPEGLAGYYTIGHMSRDLDYHPTSIDPTIAMNNEAETIYLLRVYMLTPVVSALHYSRSGGIQTFTEETAVVNGITSRVDLSIATKIGQDWRRIAIIECKRPGAIIPAEWNPVIDQDGVLGEGADRICRQLHKYAYNYDVPYVAVWDGLVLVLVLLFLGGTRDTWCSNLPRGTTPNGAAYRWIANRFIMKKNLWVWLKEAYDACRANHGIV